MLLIKAGGGKTINWEYIAEDLARLLKKEQVVIVHGASARRDELARELGAPTQTVTSPSGVESVYTDQRALEIFLMAYSGLVNKQIVATFIKHGVDAVGLSGVDGLLWQAKPKRDLLVKVGNKTKLIRDNRTGRVEIINTELIRLLCNSGYVPIISAPAISYEREIVNTDNDWTTAIMAGALKIKKLVVLFEAPGLLTDVCDESSIVAHIAKKKLRDYFHHAQGRMKKKILGAEKAIQLGVETIYWGDGRIKNPITNALQGKGTIIK